MCTCCFGKPGMALTEPQEYTLLVPFGLTAKVPAGWHPPACQSWRARKTHGPEHCRDKPATPVVKDPLSEFLLTARQKTALHRLSYLSVLFFLSCSCLRTQRSRHLGKKKQLHKCPDHQPPGFKGSILPVRVVYTLTEISVYGEENPPRSLLVAWTLSSALYKAGQHKKGCRTPQCFSFRGGVV